MYKWIYYGYIMDILWIYYGYIMDILWIYYGYIMDMIDLKDIDCRHYRYHIYEGFHKWGYSNSWMVYTRKAY